MINGVVDVKRYSTGYEMSHDKQFGGGRFLYHGAIAESICEPVVVYLKACAVWRALPDGQALFIPEYEEDDE